MTSSGDGEEESAKARVAKLIAEAEEEKDKRIITQKELREQLEETTISTLERFEATFKASLAESLESVKNGLRDEFHKSLPDFGIIKQEAADLKEQVHSLNDGLNSLTAKFHDHVDDIESADLKRDAAQKTHLQILEAKQKTVLSDIRGKALKIKGESIDTEDIVKTVLAQLEPRLAMLTPSQQQLSTSLRPDLSTNEFYGQAPKFPQHLLLSDRTSHIHAAIEEGHYFKVGINPELQLSKFKQQNINFSRLADIEKTWEEYLYGTDYLHRYQQEAKKIVSTYDGERDIRTHGGRGYSYVYIGTQAVLFGRTAFDTLQNRMKEILKETIKLEDNSEVPKYSCPAWKDPNKNPCSTRFMTQELHLENAVRAGRLTLIFYRGSMERLSSTNLQYELLEKHLGQEEVSNGVFQWMQKVIIGANAVGTDKELEDLMNQLLSLDYDILTGGCVLHWVTALERIVNILQDKMGPDFERERHIDMLHVRAINFHKRQFTAQNVATLLTQASREYGQFLSRMLEAQKVLRNYSSYMNTVNTLSSKDYHVETLHLRMKSWDEYVKHIKEQANDVEYSPGAIPVNYEPALAQYLPRADEANLGEGDLTPDPYSTDSDTDVAAYGQGYKSGVVPQAPSAYEDRVLKGGTNINRANRDFARRRSGERATRPPPGPRAVLAKPGTPGALGAGKPAPSMSKDQLLLLYDKSLKNIRTMTFGKAKEKLKTMNSENILKQFDQINQISHEALSKKFQNRKYEAMAACLLATAQALAANLREELTERINYTLSNECSNFLDDETLCVFAKKNLTEDSDQAFFSRVAVEPSQDFQPGEESN